MPAYLTQDQFLAKCELHHKGRYDYSLVDYKGGREDILIICEKHGTFKQLAARHAKGKNCRKCGYESMSAKATMSQDAVIAKCVSVHGDKYDYSKTKHVSSKVDIVVTCKVHGDFKVSLHRHLGGAECKKCYSDTMRVSQESFISKCTEVHGGKYDYSETVYKGSASKINVTCPVHKTTFSQRADSHSEGVGCPTCCKEKGTYYTIKAANRNKSEYVDTPSGLYVLRMHELGEDGVYKIGVAVNIKRRLYQIAREIGHPPTLLYYAPSNLYDSIITEQGLHDSLSEFSYTSPIKFGGYTECFSLPDETATDLIEYLNETFGEDTEIHE